jgi:ribosomal protein S18 acetylase RimI-like enzyme
MSSSGEPRPTFRPLEATDIGAISRVHHRACLIAYRFMNWSYPLSEVEAWYAGKFAEWTWTLAAFDADGAMGGFIALIDRHVDQLYVDPSSQSAGIGSTLLVSAFKAVPGRITLDVFEENMSARAFYERHGFQARDRWMNEEEGAIDLLYVREQGTGSRDT